MLGKKPDYLSHPTPCTCLPHMTPVHTVLTDVYSNLRLRRSPTPPTMILGLLLYNYATYSMVTVDWSMGPDLLVPLPEGNKVVCTIANIFSSSQLW